MPLQAREKKWRRCQALFKERTSWYTHWEELAQFFGPRMGQFFGNSALLPFGGSNGVSVGTNRGDKKHTHIYDNTPLRSVNVFSAGMIAGMTSPARPWFRLRTPDDRLNQRHEVRAWLQDVEEIMRNVYAQSNVYRSFRRIYEELAVFGTAASIMLPDFDEGVRHYPLTAGEFALDTDSKERVNTLFRRFDMTVGQLVDRFGYESCSKQVQSHYDDGNLHIWVPVVHGLEPRRERDPFKLDNKNMPWSSCYFEIGAEEDKFLRVSGFRRFPAITPRWKLNGHDIYGESPAMMALGDDKQLQHQQYRKAQAIDFQTMPPLQVPSMLSEAVAKGPGGITIVPSIVAGQAIKPAWEVDLNLEYLGNDIRDVRQRIAQALFEDMFLLFTTTRAGVQPPTAEEIVAQQEEKLLMIGPAVENLTDEQLSPVIEETFAVLLERGALPPAPEALHGQPLVIRFVSTLAQAQKLIGLSNLDRMIGTLANLAAIKPEAIDKLDGDRVVDYYADALGVDPDLIVASDRVALIREQRAALQQQAELTAALPATAKAAKDLGETDPNAASATVQALQNLGGTP